MTFAKSGILAQGVSISMSEKMPVMVEYQMADLGYIRFYLAPKFEEDSEMKES